MKSPPSLFDKLSSIEQEFYNIEPEFTLQLHKSISDKKIMDVDYKDRLVTSYQDCYVGTIRQRLHMPKRYESMIHGKEYYCSACTQIADQFVRDEDVKDKKEYLFHLEVFKQHMIGDHGKLI